MKQTVICKKHRNSLHRTLLVRDFSTDTYCVLKTIATVFDNFTPPICTAMDYNHCKCANSCKAGDDRNYVALVLARWRHWHTECVVQVNSWLPRRSFKVSVPEFSSGELGEPERCRSGENPTMNSVRDPTSELVLSAGGWETVMSWTETSSRIDPVSERVVPLALTDRTLWARRHSFVKVSSSSSGVTTGASCAPSVCRVPRRWRSSSVACSATM